VVLIPRSAWLGLVLGVVLLAGCSESLFGAHGAGGNGGDDDGVVIGCTAPCNADAAADFDGTADGTSGQWRYLDDHRDRTWNPMKTGKQAMTGADQGTRITTCRSFPGEPACGNLPGALLVTTVAPADNDPAIELTVAEPQVLDLHLQAFVPSGGADQTIRLYRNSREDELFTTTAVQGTPLDHTITLAAIPGDRFLVAVAARTVGTINIGLNLRSTASPTPFPASCQVAVPFASAKGDTVDDLCGKTVFSYYRAMGSASPPSLDPGPFPEHGKAATFALGEYFGRGPGGATMSPPLDWSQDVTVQFWALAGAPSITGSEPVLFSDLDPDYGSGIELSLSQSGQMLKAETCAAPVSPPTSVQYVDANAAYPNRDDWHFIRAVRTAGHVRVCVDGVPAASVAAAPCTAPSAYPLQLGTRAAVIDPFFNGQLDDVRVFTGALPCDLSP
jgi:hypothetical protein